MRALAIVGLLCLALPVAALAGDGDAPTCDACIGTVGTISPNLSWQTISGSTVGQPNNEQAYIFCAIAGGTYSFTTCEDTPGAGASYDTALSIWNNAGGICGAQLACNDDDCGASFLHSYVSFVAPADGEYIIVVDGFSTSTGSYTLAYMGDECAQPTPTEEASWGAIKAVYR